MHEQTTRVLHPYRFVDKECDKPVGTAIVGLIESLADEPKPTPEQAGRLANICYGVGSCYSPVYKLMGWAWDIRQLPSVQRILVEDPRNRGTWHTHWAVNKTALRLAMASVNSAYHKAEMVYA